MHAFMHLANTVNTMQASVMKFIHSGVLGLPSRLATFGQKLQSSTISSDENAALEAGYLTQYLKLSGVG